MKVKLKRVYEEFSEEDGNRILVDRLWPRGLTKEKAHVDLWLKEVAPSNELRKWFAHDPAKWPEFKERYKAELKHNTAQLSLLKQAITKGPATLLYGAKDTEHNEAVVLQELLSR
ncbi:MAG TPA: DUF488 domain-containing protein [Edaphobacter sp.]|jgi:uncharacterized protein YeaO (DUF488 family)|nr:DUF488 domain-containing protein [Edaphobacter sp.]